MYGTDLGVAESVDGRRTWTYRGTLTGLETDLPHPGRVGDAGKDDTYATRRSSLQVAAARVVDGTLHCDRDEPVRLDLSPVART